MKTFLFILASILGVATLGFSLFSMLIWIGIPAAIIIAGGNIAGLFAVSWVWFFVSLTPIVTLVLAKISAVLMAITGGLAGISK